MNKVILMGRLTRDPEVRYSQGNNSMAIARWSLAVDRRFKREGEPSTDFINCVAFGKTAELAEKYYRQGTKLAVCGHIQTGNYVNKDGVKVNTFDVVVDESEFAESKSNGSSNVAQQNNAPKPSKPQGNPNAFGGGNANAFGNNNGFMSVPDGVGEELPFN